MSTHSPSPWKLLSNSDGKCTQIYADDERICEPVCVVDHDDVTEEGSEVVRANMSLIAAAPDMLDTLKMIADFAPGNGDVCELIAKYARAAIAKAT